MEKSITYQDKEGRLIKADFCSRISSREMIYSLIRIIDGCLRNPLHDEEKEILEKEFSEALREYEHIQSLRRLKFKTYPENPCKLNKMDLSYDDGDKYNREILEQILRLKSQESTEIIKLSPRPLVGFELDCRIYDVYGICNPILISSGVRRGPSSLVVKFIDTEDFVSNKGIVKVNYFTIPINSIMKYKVLNSEE